MAFSSNSSNSSDKRDYYKECLLSTCPLPIVRLTTKTVSTIRLVPEISAAGEIMPATIGQDEFGYLWSNLTKEGQVILAGQHEKHCGFTRSADRPNERDTDNPWNSLYMFFKGQLNTAAKIGEGKGGNLAPNMTPELLNMIAVLTKREENKGSTMQAVASSILVQGFVLGLQEGGKQIGPKRAIISMGNGAHESLVSSLTTCVKQLQKDPFSFSTGYTLKVSGKTSGQGVAKFFVELGDPTPLPAEYLAAARWVPWEQCIKLQTYDENVRTIVRCYGAYLISQHPKLAEDMRRLRIDIPAMTAILPQVTAAPAAVNAFAQPAATVQAAPTFTPPLGFSSPTAPAASAPTNAFGNVGTTAPVAPAAAVPNAFTAPVASAPVTNAFAAPAASAFATPAAPPAAPLGAPATASPASLEDQYKQMVAAMATPVVPPKA